MSTYEEPREKADPEHKDAGQEFAERERERLETPEERKAREASEKKAAKAESK